MKFPLSAPTAPASFKLVTASLNSDRIVAFGEDGEVLGIAALVVNKRLCDCLLEKASPPGGETRRAAENDEAATSYAAIVP